MGPLVLPYYTAGVLQLALLYPLVMGSTVASPANQELPGPASASVPLETLNLVLQLALNLHWLWRRR